jgi:hypothetical protein
MTVIPSVVSGESPTNPHRIEKMTRQARRYTRVIFLLLPLMMGTATAQAEPACAKKCYKAETCPIIGDKCLSFDWCYDICESKNDPAAPESGSGSTKPAEPKAPLPTPDTQI